MLALGVPLVALAVAPAARAAAAPKLRVVVDGEAVALHPPAVLVDGTPYVSAEALAALLGVPSHWNARTGVLEIGVGQGSAHSFVYQGVRYSVTALQARTYTGPQSNSGMYWIVRYALTNTSGQAVDVPNAQPSLVLLGPHGAQYTPDATLSGPTAGTLNPGITFSSYDVFNVPEGSRASAYALGFDTFGAGFAAQGFQRAPLGAVLPPSSARTETTKVEATYTVSNLWNSDAQQVLIREVVRSNAILPDLSATSFDPTTTFWAVSFSINNPGADAIPLQPTDFALQFGGGASIGPYPVAQLPGYVPDSGLYAFPGSSSGSPGSSSGSPGSSGAGQPTPQAVSVPPGGVWAGTLLFEVPGSVRPAQPALAISVNGQTRVISAAPCADGTCPPVSD